MTRQAPKAGDFAFVDHTADLAIDAWGPDLGSAFAAAARGMFTHIVELGAARGDVHDTFDVAADSLDRLLFAFLDEALFQHQTRVWVFTDFDVVVAQDGDRWTARVTAHGEPWSEDRHGHVHEVKAITYHDLRVEQGPPARVYVIVDI